LRTSPVNKCPGLNGNLYKAHRSRSSPAGYNADARENYVTELPLSCRDRTPLPCGPGQEVGHGSHDIRPLEFIGEPMGGFFLCGSPLEPAVDLLPMHVPDSETVRSPEVPPQGRALTWETRGR